MSSLSYDDLFALRIELSDEFQDENLIIKELKMILLRNGFDNMDQVNNYLVEFYNNFGINMDLETIQNVQVNLIPTINILNQLINQTVMNMNPPTNLNIANNIISNNNNNINSDNEIDSDDEEFSNNPPAPQMISVSQFMNSFNDLISSIENMQPPQPLEDVKVTLKDEKKIKKYNLEEKLEEKCTVCLGELKKDDMVWELNCKHVFHQDCIKTWLKEYNYKCPICRKEAGEGETDI